MIPVPLEVVQLVVILIIMYYTLEIVGQLFVLLVLSVGLTVAWGFDRVREFTATAWRSLQ